MYAHLSFPMAISRPMSLTLSSSVSLLPSTSLSFLLHSDHGFDQAPYEAIDQGKFQEMERKIKKENAQDVRISDDDVLTSFECAKGMCPIR